MVDAMTFAAKATQGYIEAVDNLANSCKMTRDEMVECLSLFGTEIIFDPPSAEELSEALTRMKDLIK